MRQPKTKRLDSLRVEPSREVEDHVLTLTIEVPHMNKRPLSALAPNSDVTPSPPARLPICSRRLVRFRLPNAKSSAAPGIGHAEKIAVRIAPELSGALMAQAMSQYSSLTRISDPCVIARPVPLSSDRFQPSPNPIARGRLYISSRSRTDNAHSCQSSATRSHV